MDDYTMSSLVESKNEWVARLLDVLVCPMKDGLRAIFDEADEIARANEEGDKYLMTFQTFLSRIPAWNADLVKKERERIQSKSACPYLEDLITCVHIVQLKALACVRVGQKQQKVDIDLPDVDRFVHRAYTNAARKLYTCVYLFEKGLPPLQKQRNERELDQIVRESILAAVREGVPVENILKAYIAQTEEIVEAKAEDAILARPAAPPLAPKPAAAPKPAPPPRPVEELLSELAKEVPLPSAPPPVPEPAPATVPVAAVTPPPAAEPQDPKPNVLPAPTPLKLEISEIPAAPSAPAVPAAPTAASEPAVSFSDVDQAVSAGGVEEKLERPKTIEALEVRSAQLAASSADDDGWSLKIGAPAGISLSSLGESIAPPPGVAGEIEVLG